ncbi:MAG: anaerobic ribonucleoside-triphosphate reductase activating protein [Elusimicrobiota bacterium]|jgi:pyruvate formate lyase activating enzyme|nr:anaerobic ribonucleoside-triphosphate reductase activating protein [Elusimicrobiota bacterium]
MRIGGFQKLSLINYPKTVAAVVFTQGCNMFCPYCHNPELVYPELFDAALDESVVLDFLQKRKKLLQGVVITGGEPTLQVDLESFIRQIKNIGYKIKLDTNGCAPAVLKNLIEQKLLDFIAMDIKAPFEKYEKFYDGDIKNIKRSISLIKNSKILYQFRTTYDKEILTESNIEEIREIAGANFTLQPRN